MKPDDRQHIEAICRRNNIHLVTPEEHAMSYAFAKAVGRRAVNGSCNCGRTLNGQHQYGIWLNPEADGCPTEESEYLAALHEIGHCMLGHQPKWDMDDNPTEEAVDQEIAAWEWAYNHAQYWPDDETLCWTLDCIASYSDGWALNQLINNEIMNKENQLNEMLKGQGFSEQEAKNLQSNLQQLSALITMLDSGLRILNVPALKGLNDLAKRLPENDVPHFAVVSDRLTELCDIAEKYQAKFGSAEDEPQINVTTRKPITA